MQEVPLAKIIFGARVVPFLLSSPLGELTRIHRQVISLAFEGLVRGRLS
jgi:hypothetical protein